MKNLFFLFLICLVFSCKNGDSAPNDDGIAEISTPELRTKFGYVLDEYKVINDTINNGDTFGEILYTNHIEYPEVYKIVEAIKDTFDVKRLIPGKPYTILASQDSTEKAEVFIYHPNKIEYVVMNLKDSIYSQTFRKKIKIVEKIATGTITDSVPSISQVMDKKGENPNLVFNLSDIYAWTVDFFRLQQGDKFKAIYEEMYVDDTVSVGIGNIKSAYFEHKKTPFYAFNYVTDSIKNISDYYDEEANSLRRQFLKSPITFSRISSRYNLKRFIRYYGRVKPHRGTDFAARVGTPINATANGTVIESRYRGGNGNYVKIKHNSVYSTQYLHMSKRLVKVGDFVKQGDVIGKVGMTGNTSGPHVCYRFWKNGVQVDPLKQKLPSAKPIAPELKDYYLNSIASLKDQLDATPIE